MNERTHASFFSGAGGLDLGLERAGWRTVSFSEIDPYACAVLAETWPGVPNLGSITDLSGPGTASDVVPAAEGWDGPRIDAVVASGAANATLWTGGFPCQDLSIAGKRRGLDGARSGLAFAYLGLVERHRPPWVLLENVPGLLSSNRGRDLSVLLGRLSELGYGVAGRVLDARYFGVAQRRRRVFLLATRDPGGRAGAERAAEVLSIAAGGGGHPAAGGEARTGTTGRPRYGIDLARAVTGSSGKRHDDDTDTLIVPRSIDDARRERGRRQGAADLGEREPDPRDQPDADVVRWPLGAPADAGRNRETDGLAGRAHDRGLLADSGVVQSLDTKRGGADDNEAQAGHLVVSETGTGWWTEGVSALRSQPGGTPAQMAVGTFGNADDDLLPLGLDSHRYRCCGNGVVSNVAEALGWALDYVIARDEVVAA